jgi:hypothetical protein
MEVFARNMELVAPYGICGYAQYSLPKLGRARVGSDLKPTPVGTTPVGHSALPDIVILPWILLVCMLKFDSIWRHK